jgi:ribonuclease VapC
VTLFVDASAIVALMENEPGAGALAEAFDSHNDRLFSSLSHWEAARAIARKRDIPVTVAHRAVGQFLRDFGVRAVPIGEIETPLAIEAHARYGKGTGHPARLNMGDCFSYACAKANDARLLYKGDDFSHTDMAR